MGYTNEQERLYSLLKKTVADSKSSRGFTNSPSNSYCSFQGSRALFCLFVTDSSERTADTGHLLTRRRSIM